ncbi:MAG: LamG domain-containing protein, partial [Saprospiraceae bacterium]
MFQRIIVCAALLWSAGMVVPVFAQQASECNPALAQPITQGDIFFNYGGATDAYSIKNRSSYSIGQAVVGFGVSQSNNSQMGYWSRFLIPPLAPIVTATQGDLLDRIQISWAVQPLGAQPTEGYKLFRDGVFLALVDNNTNNYNDFNVIAGKVYTYEVRGINFYGDGSAGKAIGFQVPNGVVTGWVQTLNGSPVPDAMVTLLPMQGYSARFGAMDGAFAEADTSVNPFMPPNPSDDWTMTCWIKTDAATANAGIIQLSPFPLYIRALNSAGGHEGVEVATSATGTPFLSGMFADSTKNGWHHVALSFEGSDGVGRLYIDGVLVTLSPMTLVPFADVLNIGSLTGTGGWAGRMDELRIYHRQLDELDFREVMEGTASSLTPDLKQYWKFDEQQGVKSYDVMKREKMYFCGAAFDPQRPPVRTAGKTNQDGYYRIESASYGTGTTFLAQPMKEFYAHRALKMVRNEGDYATLPDFSITPKATLELWVNSAGPGGTQCLLSKKSAANDFRLLVKQNGLQSELWFYLNGQEFNFGTLGMGYQHLAFTIDS